MDLTDGETGKNGKKEATNEKGQDSTLHKHCLLAVLTHNCTAPTARVCTAHATHVTSQLALHVCLHSSHRTCPTPESHETMQVQCLLTFQGLHFRKEKRLGKIPRQCFVVCLHGCEGYFNLHPDDGNIKYHRVDGLSLKSPSLCAFVLSHQLL